jgi:hypothetical protein
MTDNGVTALTTRDNDPYVLYAVDFSGEVYALLPKNFDRLEAGGSDVSSVGGSVGGSAGGSSDAKPAGTSLAGTPPAPERKSKAGLFGRLFGKT